MQPTKGLWSDDQEVPSTRDGTLYRMANGREYLVTRSLLAEDPTILERGVIPLTRYIDEHPEENPVVFGSYNANAILLRPPLPFKERTRLLAREIVRRLDHRPGQLLIDCSTPNTKYLDLLRSSAVSAFADLLSMLIYWEEQGLVSLRRLADSTTYVTLTVRGLIAFEEDEVTTDSDSAFIAMWFSPEMTAAYDNAIAPAVEKLGYRPVRIDRREHNNKIDDEIIAEIRRAHFVIADFSCGADGARGGVYFEAGFAAGLGKTVIYMVREPDLEVVHFDTRQFNHIVWTSAEDLQTKLVNRIGATIGDRSKER